MPPALDPEGGQGRRSLAPARNGSASRLAGGRGWNQGPRVVRALRPGCDDTMIEAVGWDEDAPRP